MTIQHDQPDLVFEVDMYDVNGLEINSTLIPLDGALNHMPSTQQHYVGHVGLIKFR